jgi:acetyl esterase
MPLLPVFQALLDSRPDKPPIRTMALKEIRQANIDLIKMFGEPEPVNSIVNRDIPGPAGPIPVRIYRPEGKAPLPILMCFHGGGWVAGNINVFDNISRALTNRVGCLTISVDYHLAPEYKFPVPLEDCYAATNWVASHANQLGGDPTRIAVLGESAGGNLTAALALLSRDRGGPALVYQVLVYPPLEYPDPGFPSMQEFSEGYDLTRADLRWCMEQYIPQESYKTNPYCFPLEALDLSGLPPALILTAEYDPVRDESEEYGQRLREAGVLTTIKRYEGVLHAFFVMTELAAPCKQVLEDAAYALRCAFKGSENG